jgi:hypothetical protein
MKKYLPAIACVALIFLGGLLNGTMDKLQFHYSKSVFPQGPDDKLLGKGELFWNPKLSWRNKYKGGDPELGPAYPGATTWLVSTTDAWHLLKTLMMACYHLAILIGLVWYYRWPKWLLLAAPLPLNAAVFGLAFTIMFHHILIRK